ncbi:MAG: hypothetical protein AAGA20_22595, partial [Planctomycetota bacterium]
MAPTMSKGGTAPAAWRVSGLRQEIDEPDERVFERAARAIGLELAACRSARFARRSLDARGRGRDLHFVCQVDVAGPAD